MGLAEKCVLEPYTKWSTGRLPESMPAYSPDSTFKLLTKFKIGIVAAAQKKIQTGLYMEVQIKKG